MEKRMFEYRGATIVLRTRNERTYYEIITPWGEDVEDGIGYFEWEKALDEAMHQIDADHEPLFVG